MSTSFTPNLNLPVYDEGDSAGAGSKTVPGSGGWNDIPLICDVAIGVAHTAAGAHKADVIDKAHLKTTVADAATIEKDGTVGLRVKDDGVTGAKIAAAFADNSTLEMTAATGAKQIRIKDAGVTGAKLASGVADGSTLELASGALREKDGGTTWAKLATAAQQKMLLCLEFEYDFTADNYRCGGKVVSSAYGIRIPFDATVMYFSVVKSDGAGNSATVDDQYDGGDIAAGTHIGVGAVTGPFHVVLAGGTELNAGQGTSRITKDNTKDALLAVFICAR